MTPPTNRRARSGRAPTRALNSCWRECNRLLLVVQPRARPGEAGSGTRAAPQREKMAFICRATSFDPRSAERPLPTHMMQQSVDEGRISRGTLRRETDTLTASSRQFHRTGDDMRRLAPLQPTEGLASPRTAQPVMPHLAHNYNYGWHPPARLQTTDAFYGSGWSNPRTLDIEHVISRAPHALLPTHGPRPTSLAACSRWPSAAPQFGPAPS